MRNNLKNIFTINKKFLLAGLLATTCFQFLCTNIYAMNTTSPQPYRTTPARNFSLTCAILTSAMPGMERVAQSARSNAIQYVPEQQFGFSKKEHKDNPRTHRTQCQNRQGQQAYQHHEDETGVSNSSGQDKIRVDKNVRRQNERSAAQIEARRARAEAHAQQSDEQEEEALPAQADARLEQLANVCALLEQQLADNDALLEQLDDACAQDDAWFEQQLADDDAWSAQMADNDALLEQLDDACSRFKRRLMELINSINRTSRICRN